MQPPPLSGIGTLINFISVCGGEQLLPVCAGGEGRGSGGGEGRRGGGRGWRGTCCCCLIVKMQQKRVQSLPNVSKGLRQENQDGTSRTRNHRQVLVSEDHQPWNQKPWHPGTLVQRQTPVQRWGGYLSGSREENAGGRTALIKTRWLLIKYCGLIRNIIAEAKSTLPGGPGGGEGAGSHSHSDSVQNGHFH